MDNLSFQYPTWYFFGCLLLGLVYAALMYYRDARFNDSSNWKTWLLSILRFLAVSGLATLLLSPLLKKITNETKKPKIVILQDKSNSIEKVISADSVTAVTNKLNQINSALSENYEVSHYSFGESIFSSSDSLMNSTKITNLSNAIQYTYDVYNDQNLGAIILSTDGIYNEGKNPLYQNLSLKAPIYTIGLGDTIKKKDLSIKHVYFNKIAYLGDKFNIQVDIQGNNANGSRTKLTISKETSSGFTKVEERSISINKKNFFSTETITLDASTAGVSRYRVSLGAVANESSTANNRNDIYIEVLDARQKILLYGNAPHPDLAALKQILNTNKNYEVEIKFAKEDISTPSKYDFYVFHNLPSKKHNVSALLQSLNTRKTPRMYIIGAQTDMAAFNQVQNTVKIDGANVSLNDVQPVMAPDFSLFKMDEATKNNIKQFVPLQSPYGKYTEGPNTNTLLLQKIGSVGTEYPLLSYSENQGLKTAVLCGEGIWKWKLYNYLQYENYDVVKDILNKTVTYTSVKEDKRKFRVSSSKNLYKENEQIYFDAELYNNSYQLTNEPDAFINIKNAQGEEFKFTMTKQDNYYTLDAGKFGEGTYTYNASLNNKGEVLKQSGKFTVQSIQLELHNLTADHNLLHQLSEKYGGKFYTSNTMSDITTEIQNAANIKPVIYSTTSTRSIIHYKWLFGILIVFLIVEWFLRRYFGTY